jgi:hypothetical protein
LRDTSGGLAGGRALGFQRTAVIESVIGPAIFFHVPVVALMERDGGTPGKPD